MINKILTSIIILLLIIVSYFYVQNNNLINNLADTKDSLTVSEQNKNYFIDKLNQTDSSFQELTFKVENLQTINSRLNQEVKILNIDITALGDTINILKQSTDVEKTDSTIKVPFKGKKGKVTYNGNTIYYTKIDSATYSIDIKVDPTQYSAEVLYDSVKSIIIRVLADGTIIGNLDAKIDKQLLLLLKNNAPTIHKKTIFDDIGAFGTLYYLNSRLALKLGLYYNITDNMTVYSDYKFNDMYYTNHFEVGIQYHYPFSKFLKGEK